MSLQLSSNVRNDQATAFSTRLYTSGTTPTMLIYNGTEPANCGTALSGNTILASGTLASTGAAQFSESSGVLSLASNITLTGQSGAGTGTTGTFYRMLDSAGTCHAQGNVGTSCSFTGSISGTVLTVSAVTSGAITNGSALAGTTIASGSTITSFGTGTGGTGTYNVSISQTVSSEAMTSTPDLVLPSSSIANTETITVSTFTITMGNS
jgi:hypothetical protein